MDQHIRSAEALKDIRSMMDRSSRFISLSGLSGISAGICALIGAWLAHPYVYRQKNLLIDKQAPEITAPGVDYSFILNTWLFWIAAGTFIAAFLSAFFFTWLKSNKDRTPTWGIVARRLMFNVSMPLIVGGIFIYRLMPFGAFGFVAPGCLIFYGLALVNASKYTLIEIRYLGYLQIALGLINMFFIGCGLYFWAGGFGILHILYGIYMWQKYDRNNKEK